MLFEARTVVLKGHALKWILRSSIYFDKSIIQTLNILKKKTKLHLWPADFPIKNLIKDPDTSLFLLLGADTRGRCQTSFSNNNWCITSPTPKYFTFLSKYSAPKKSNNSNVRNLHANHDFHWSNFMKVVGTRGWPPKRKYCPCISIAVSLQGLLAI